MKNVFAQSVLLMFLGGFFLVACAPMKHGEESHTIEPFMEQTDVKG